MIHPPPELASADSTTVLRFLGRLHGPGHQALPLHWPRRLCPHLPSGRPTVAILQQEPRAVVVTSHQIQHVHRCRRGEGGIDAVGRQVVGGVRKGAMHHMEDRRKRDTSCDLGMDFVHS